jgi:hypothetical protein
MGGSTDAFALYLSLFQVSRPTDPSKPTTSLSFHKEAESKFEFGTSTLKPDQREAPQEELMSYEDVKAGLEEKKEEGEMETVQVQANPTARAGRRLGGDGQEAGEDKGKGEEEEEENPKPSMRELAVRAAEKRAQLQQQQQGDEVEGLKAGKVEEVQGRAQPAA